MDSTTSDPVIEEFDVHFNSKLSGVLSLIQFPLRDARKQYPTDESNSSLKIKPKSRKIEYSVPFLNPNRLVDQSEWTTSHSSLSGTTLPLRTRYAIGVLRRESDSNVLHLTPIESIVQLRPSFEHVNAADEMNQKEEENRKTDSKKKALVDVESKSEALPVNVLFHRKESAKVTQMKMKLPAHQLRMEQQEESIQLKVSDKNSSSSSQLIQQMVSVSNPFDIEKHPKSQWKINEQAFVDILCAQTCETKAHSYTHSQSNSLSWTTLKTMPKDTQLVAVLLTGKVMPYYEIRELLNTSFDSEEELLELLQTNAMLIEGLWIVKSRLFPEWKGTRSGLPVVRDYLLSLFAEDPKIRISVHKVFTDLCEQVPKEIIVKVLRTIAKTDHYEHSIVKFANSQNTENTELSSWELLRECDYSFARSFPHIVHNQQTLWKEFNKTTSANISRLVRMRLEKSKQEQTLQTTQTRQINNQTIYSQQTNEKTQMETQLKSKPANRNLPQTQIQSQTESESQPFIAMPIPQHVRRQTPQNVITDISQRSSSIALTPPPLLFKSEIVPLADDNERNTLIGNTTGMNGVIPIIEDDEAIPKLVDFVETYLKTACCATLQHIKVALSRHILSSSDPSGVFLNGCVNEQQLFSAVNEVCEEVQNVYCLKWRKDVTDTINQYRSNIMNAFRTIDSLRRSELKSKVTANITFDDRSYQIATGELCIKSGNMFYFRTEPKETFG